MLDLRPLIASIAVTILILLGVALLVISLQWPEYPISQTWPIVAIAAGLMLAVAAAIFVITFILDRRPLRPEPLTAAAPQATQA